MTSNPASYTVETKTITLENPTRTGYTFGGWYTDEACTETNKVTEIKTGSTGNLTLYAQWTANTYTVQFNANDNSVAGTMENQTFTYDKKEPLNENSFSRTGYIFTGWNTKANGSGTSYADKESVSNLTATANGEVTLYAQWAEAEANAYYVRNNGDDNNNSGTSSSPFKTVQKAVNTAITSNDGETTYKIYVMSDITGGVGLDFLNDNYALINIAPTEKLNLKISGYDNTVRTIDAIKGGCLMYIGANAVVTLENITLTNGYMDSEQYSGGVCIDGGTLNMNSGATISNCTALKGGGVYLLKGTFNMSGGSIENCKADSLNDYGGGVYMENGTFNMSGGTISWSGDDYCAEQGGGVYMNDGIFTMSGSAKIEGCKTYQFGGGIYVMKGTFEMTGGEITECKVFSNTEADNYGGGVYMENGTFTMSGGTISSCEVNNPKSGKSAYGGGVYQKAGTFTMNGGTISGCKVIISGDNSTGVTNGGGVYQAGGTFEMKNGTISGCTAKQGGGVYKESGSFQMSGSAEINTCEAEQGGGVYKELGSFSISGGKISSCIAKQQGGGVYQDNNSTAVSLMMSGGEISNCTAEQGGGVYINNGNFKMSGSAEIYKCEASEKGGGVYQNRGRFEIFYDEDGTNDVIISNNTAKSGGGVCVYSGTFSMNSGSISDNKVKSDSAQGGGVLVIGNFFMHNGNITNNRLEYERIDTTLISGGAGVAVSLKVGSNGAQQTGKFTMNGGEISGNTITDNYNHAKGEDLFVISGGTFTYNAGTINNDKIYNDNNQ